MANPTASPSPVDQDASLTLSVAEPSVAGTLAYKWGTTSGGNNLGTTRTVSGSGGNFTGTSGSKTFYLTVTHTLSGCSSTQNKTISVTVNSADCGYSSITQTGAIKGEFSVSATKKVYFSEGNLTYNASAKKFMFAANQYDVQGGNTGTGNTTAAASRASQSALIDLFCSGSNNTATSGNYYPYQMDYGRTVTQNGTGDWGQNTIYRSNGSTSCGTGWQTMTDAEMNYLLNVTSNAKRENKVGTAVLRIGTKNYYGLILLPDCFNDPKSGGSSQNTAFVPNNPSGPATYGTNYYTESGWTTMQNNGAVFLPAAGYANDGSTTINDDTPRRSTGGAPTGYYWLTSGKILYWIGQNKCVVGTSPYVKAGTGNKYRYAVRLVKPIN